MGDDQDLELSLDSPGRKWSLHVPAGFFARLLPSLLLVLSGTQITRCFEYVEDKVDEPSVEVHSQPIRAASAEVPTFPECE